MKIAELVQTEFAQLVIDIVSLKAVQTEIKDEVVEMKASQCLMNMALEDLITRHKAMRLQRVEFIKQQSKYIENLIACLKILEDVIISLQQAH